MATRVPTITNPEQFVFGQKLELFKRGQARLCYDVVFKIQYALKLLQLHVEQQADARRQRFHEPDMRNRRSQLNMAHAFAADKRMRHFHSALVADNAFVTDATATTFLSTVAGGGANKVPVVSDGTNWLIG